MKQIFVLQYISTAFIDNALQKAISLKNMTLTKFSDNYIFIDFLRRLVSPLVFHTETEIH